jgi:leucyl-tRNA synthetase
MEHTTLHLLYSRFWYKFLYDLGVSPTSEPYAKRSSHGVVLGIDGRKMSKSKGNVINPDEVVNKYGADTLRLYEMFIGPFDQAVAWSWEGVEGVYRFLKRVWKLVTNKKLKVESSSEARLRLAKLIRKVEADLECNKFNTAVAACMEFTNWWGERPGEMGKQQVIDFLKVIAPMAPFITEELFWQLSGKSANYSSIHLQDWPKIDPGDVGEEMVTIAVQVNGKLRGKIVQFKSVPKEGIEKLALENENVKKYVQGKYLTIFVPGKIINFITK